MSFKTLIVFDTNALRIMDGSEVAYNDFSFGRAYDLIDLFVQTNKLEEDVTLIVSTMVISELKTQKNRAYKKDILALKDIVRRLTGLPNIPDGSITIPDENFDCASFIEEQAQRYIQFKNIQTIEHKDEDASSMLKNMLAKIIGYDIPKSPFAVSGKYYKDAGFKDSIIWETLMHYDKVPEYDKVIFFTKDGDFRDNCITDFQLKWQRHITIEKDENAVIDELNKDYGNYIEERTIYSYSQTEYFKDYLFELLKSKVSIVLEQNEYRIVGFEITNICKLVVRMPLNEDDAENVIVISAVKILYNVLEALVEKEVDAITTLWDDETKEIITTEFNFELK